MRDFTEADTRSSLGDAPAIPMPLANIVDRINRATNAINNIADENSRHADAVFGASPEMSASNTPQATNQKAYRSGWMGEIDAALDRLDDVVSHNAMQAGRNCTLA